MFDPIVKTQNLIWVSAMIGALVSFPIARALESLPDIPYKKFVLDNGLTVIVHEDHKAPIVAINLWYHVGSKNEPDRRSGFAHLFEHLMFNGSENFNDDYFQALERAGATDLNGTTSEDRTNYFQNVPKNALDLALWMESDRMGHLLGVIDQGKLDEQRGVVQNEKRQGENEPYGQVWNLITYATYPREHPYGHTVIGSMEDLNAASLDDVRDWFKTYYGPNNAVIVIAGDVETETAREKVQRFFGDIPPGPPINKFSEWIAKRTGEQRQILQDRVPQARVYKVWNIPAAMSADTSRLELVARILASGKTSRLYKRLVYEDQIATDVSARIDNREIGGQFMISATARPGQDLTAVETAIDEELARFLELGSTEMEILRATTEIKAEFLRGLQRIGGFGGKSDILASSQVYGGSPDAWKKNMQISLASTPEVLRETARRWLSDGVYVLEVHPFPELQSAKTGVDRSQVPEPGAAPSAKFPELHHAELSNGLKIVLAERHSAPLAEFRLILDAGYASDQSVIPGTASLAMNMLDEGTTSRTALEISEELALLGGELGSGSDLDGSTVSLSVIKENLSPSLDLLADVILNPSFPNEELERQRKQQLARIQREKVTPIQMALRVFPKLLYGEGHAYALPFTGSGTEESVQRIQKSDLESFHAKWFKPNHATLVVAGDVTLDELVPLLEKRFTAWEPGETPEKQIGQVAHKSGSMVYLMDRPGSQQSIIFAGHVAPPKSNPNETAIETMNTILGGAFTSRINMNLREEKGWAYGAFTLLFDARGQRPFLVYAPVQTDKTSESISEIASELKAILGSEPITEDELVKAQKNQTLSLAGRWETIGAVASSISEIVRYGLPDNHWETYVKEVRALGVDQVGAAARDILHPDKLVWVVVGDLEKTKSSIQALNLGKLHLIDADGNVIDQR